MVNKAKIRGTRPGDDESADLVRLAQAESALQRAAHEFVKEDAAGSGGMPLVRAQRALNAAARKYADALRAYCDEEAA